MKGLSKLEGNSHVWMPSGCRFRHFVDPCMCPLVGGISRNTRGENARIPIKRKRFIPDGLWSFDYQWLPSEILVGEDGKVKIGSYINSIPFDSGLYLAIAQLIQLAVPLF